MGCSYQLTIFCIASGLGTLAIWIAWTSPGWTRVKTEFSSGETKSTYELGLVTKRYCERPHADVDLECKSGERTEVDLETVAEDAKAAWNALYDWEKGVLALCLLSWLAILVAWIWGLSYSCCTCCKYLWVCTILPLLAFVMTLVAVIVYRVMYNNKHDVTVNGTTTSVPYYDGKLFYAFYMAVAADSIFLGCAIFAFFMAKDGSGVRPLF